MNGWLDTIRRSVVAHPRVARWLLAGPGALIAAVLTMAAMPVWLPAGQAGLNNIAYPILLAPLIWTVIFTYSCIEENLPRGVAIMAVAIVVQGVAVIVAVAGGG